MEDNTQTTKEEDKKFKDIFPWEHKNEYNYTLITIVDENKDLNLKEEKSFVYFGRDKKDKKKYIYVKGMNLKHEKTPQLI